MDELIIQRVRLFVEKEEISQAEIAKKVFSTPDLVSKWFTAKQKMPYPIFIELVKKLPKLNVRWVLTGEGEMLNEGSKSNVIDGFKITEVGCPLCYPREREITTQNKLIALLEEKIKEFESSQNKKPTEKIGYKKDEPGIDKAAETTGKYKVTNERLLKLNANLSDRVD